ncbi:MAG: acyl carrier protein [Promethearchaeota archaeon]
MSDLDSELKTIFENVLGLDSSVISDKLSQKECDQWDSMAHLLLITELEEFYSLHFSEDEIIAMHSYAEVKKILSQYI